MTVEDEFRHFPAELVEQARAFPGGWVYEIDGEYSANEAVPPEAIRGAWQVDSGGNLTGHFEVNPRFRPQSG